jgi:membrane protease YdiL (CAAX protease family)
MKSFFSETESPKMNAIKKCAIFWILFAFSLIIRKVVSKYVLGFAWERFDSTIVGPILTLSIIAIMLKMERKNLADIGLKFEKDTIFKFLKGSAIGILIFLSTVVFFLLFTEATFISNNYKWHTTLIFLYLAILPVSFVEELAFRSYPLIALNKVFGLRATQLIIAIAYALFHIFQGWSFTSAFLSTATISFIYVLSAVWSKGIAIPTGIHTFVILFFQLIGINTTPYGQIYVLNLPKNASLESIAHASVVGVSIKLGLLLLGIILTEYFIRKKQTITV